MHCYTDPDKTNMRLCLVVVTGCQAVTSVCVWGGVSVVQFADLVKLLDEIRDSTLTFSQQCRPNVPDVLGAGT